MLKRRDFMGFSLGFLASCAKSHPLVSAPEVRERLNSRAEKALQFTVTDVQGLAQLQRDYEAFRQALAEALDRPVDFYPVENYTGGALALRTGDVDLALTGPSEYVLIRARTNAIALLAITRPHYHALIVVPSHSPVQRLSQLKGKTIAMLRVGSTSGHLGPTALLIEAGLDPKTDYQVKMLGREGSLQALQAETVEAWGGPLIDYERFLREQNLPPDQFRILQKSPLLPKDVFMVRSTMDMEEVQALRDRLLQHQTPLIAALATPPANEKFRQSTFVPVQESDYDLIRKVYRAIGEGTFLE